MAEIDLILPVGPGLHPQLQHELVGELTMDHVALLRVSGPVWTSNIQRITERHKAMARAIATGTTTDEVAFLFGMTQPSVTRLKQDPAFKNLVEYFSRVEDEIVFSTQGRLASVTNLAIDRIEERLLDDEETKKMPVNTLLEIVKTGADRTGNGPQSSTVAINVNANLADRMKAAREKANASMRDITPAVAAE